MARATVKKKSKTKVEKEAEQKAYVASTMNITYTMPKGLAHMLAATGPKNTSVSDVWTSLSEMANICASRLAENSNQNTSWTRQKFPGTEVYIRIDMKKYQYGNWSGGSYVPGPASFMCSVEISGGRSEQFTQTQVNDYITEKILLGDDDEEESTQNA